MKPRFKVGDRVISTDLGPKATPGIIGQVELIHYRASGIRYLVFNKLEEGYWLDEEALKLSERQNV